MEARAHLPLLILLVMALAVRMVGLGNPPTDIHHVRQSDTASIARNMARNGIDVLHPRIDWAGPEAGTVESELPLYNAMVAVGWGWFGSGGTGSWVWARLLSILAWLGGGIALLAWVRRRLPGPHWAYLALYALSPLAIAFSRTIQPDALALGLMLCSLERADAASDRGGPAAWVVLVIAGLTGGLAVSVKATALLFVLLGPVILAIRKGGPGAVGAALVAALTVVPAAAWYWHAHAHLGVDGATFGIWGGSAHKWATPTVVLDANTWRAIGGTLVMHALTPLGVAALVVFGRGRSVGSELRPFAVALGLAAVSMVVAAEAFRLHNYYQLLLVPFASVLCGVGGLTAFTRLRDAAMSRQQRVTWAAGAALLALWTALAGGFFVADAARTDRRLTATGQQLQAVVGRGEAVVVVDRHPQSVLFAADRRGFHRSSTSFGEVLELERAGARFVFITETSTSFSDAGLVVQLQESRRLAARSHTWLLYALNPPADAAAAPSPAPSPTGTSDDDDSASDDDDSSIAPEAPTAPAD